MTIEKWENLTGMIRENFGIDEQRKEKLDLGEDAKGKKVEGEIEIIEFKGPLGMMKLELIIKPLILEKKTLYSHRIGGQVRVNYLYSETEKTYQLKAYQKKENEWIEIKAEKLIK